MNSPLRIAMLSEHVSPWAALRGGEAYGEQVAVAQAAAALAHRGHRVDVFTRRDAPQLADVVDVQPGLRVVHVPAGAAAPVPHAQWLLHVAAFGANALQLMRHGEPYHVVHANFFISGLIGLRLKERLGLPLVVTFHALGLVRREHQGAADAFPPERVAIERRIVRGADRVVAECPQDRADLMRLYGARPERIATLPCGVDTASFRPGTKAEARRALGLPDEEFVILQVGRIVPRKGVDNVIRAVGRMDRARPVRLLIVGGDVAGADPQASAEIARLQAVVSECGVADAVNFTGARPHAALRDFYVAADVVVSTPWYAPSALAVLEAMACGTPVVGSAVGGIRQAVVDGVTGYLVPPRDPVMLAQRLQRLRAVPVLAQAFGRAGRRRVCAHFSCDQVAAGLVATYRSLRSGGGEPASAWRQRADTARSAAPTVMPGAAA